MEISSRFLKSAAGAISALLLAAAASARPSVPLAQDVANELSGPVRAGERVVVPRLALDDGSEISLDLEAFEVFAPGATILEYTDQGPRHLPPPADRYFRGSVIGDPDSLVVLGSGSTLRGFIYTKGTLYAIAPDRNVYGDDLPELVSRLRRVDPERDRPSGLRPFRCDAESLPAPPPEGMNATALAMPISVQPLWTSTVYTVTLAIETDYELRQLFSSTDGEIRYIADLTAAASAIYWRDVKTVFQIGTVHLWTTSGDPWTATDTESALYEVGDYWHANYSGVARTTVHFLSGKDMGGGIAWLGVLCQADFYTGAHYGGGYGVSSSLNGQFSTTSPSLYWDIDCFMHEIGHNFDSPHTHCYSPPIDHCYNGEPGCYSGALCVNGTSDPCTGGTIMSYCHNRPGYFSNLILYLGQAGQPSQAVTDLIRGYVESKASCLTLLAAAPTVTGVSPSSGSTSGGTSVTISGTGFQYYATVTIGGVAATGVAWVSSTTITAVTGAHAAGSVDVVVKNPDSQSGTKTNGYTYGSCDVTLSNQTIATTQTYTSCGTLTAGPAFRISSPGDVTARATTRVILANGFSVGDGGTFIAGFGP
jgi:hypothetical protein